MPKTAYCFFQIDNNLQPDRKMLCLCWLKIYIPSKSGVLLSSPHTTQHHSRLLTSLRSSLDDKSPHILFLATLKSLISDCYISLNFLNTLVYFFSLTILRSTTATSPDPNAASRLKPSSLKLT